MGERGQRRRAGAAFEARDRHMIGARLGDAGGDRADADFGHQLHRDPRTGLTFFRSWISCARSSIE
jgi:hypothetical protein